MKHAAIALLSVFLALPAYAQWSWRDGSGRVVYSDQPPPPGIKPDQILREGKPGSPLSTPGPSSTTESKSGPKTIAEREMEFRKRQQERGDGEKKQQEEQARSAQRAQECERMRGYLRALDDGIRVSRTNAQGEREYLDDAQRTAETARVRESIGKSCS